MKQFFKHVLATVTGLLVAGVVVSILGVAVLGAIVGASNKPTSPSPHSVLHIKLSGSIEERSEAALLASLLGDEVGTTGLDHLLTAIRVAATDDRIDGIYIEGGILSANPATLEELRHALADFKNNSDKFIIAYADNYSQSAYYVASVADKVMLNPGGTLLWHGYAATPIFYKDLLDKVGVKMQIYRVGTYKSYVEPFTRTEMNEASREQMESYLNDIWRNIREDVAADRQVSTDSLDAYADRYTVLADASEYVRLSLVDTLCYVDGLRDQLRLLTGSKRVGLAKPKDIAALGKEEKGDREIAVYYAYGSIVDSELQGVGSSNAIVGQKVVRDLDRLANDDKVKAVVLRINSGGGSAYASEQMWHAIQLLKARKPVVVSMGGMAASGGYYMSCGADYIVAEPTTLTGSIGIFGMVPDASGLLTDKLGLHFDVVKTNESADFGTVSRPLNAGESAAMQAYIDRGYALFIKRVADGRHMTAEQVDSIAQGRVWTGEQALAIHLVDSLGTLGDAIAEAARRAKVVDYSVQAYPAPKTWYEQLMEEKDKSYFDQELKATLGHYYQPLLFLKELQGTDYMQARMPYDPNLR